LAQTVDPNLRIYARVFDVYRGKGLPDGKKSVAVRFSIQSSEGTLSEKEVGRWLKAYEASAKERFEAELRA
jgi:phenylalanyl-tRNA synthetase beta chain